MLETRDRLVALECWVSYVQLLEKDLRDQIRDPILIYKDLIVTYVYYYVDWDQAAKWTRNYFEKFKPTWNAFEKDILSFCPLSDRDLSVFLFLMEQDFPKEHRVGYLEALASLCEKKIHNYEKLSEIQKQILAINPNHFQALVFFKNNFLQNEMWEEGAEIFEKILKILDQEPHKKRRFAYELASLYLYRLGNAQKTISVLEDQNFLLEIEHYELLYEAFSRINRWDRCLFCVQQILTNLPPEKIRERGVAFYEKALTLQHLKKNREALSALEEAIELIPDYWEAYEVMVIINLEKKDWSALTVLFDKISSQFNSPQETPILKRLRDLKEKCQTLAPA